jgi:hypothetical protein
MSSRWPAAPWIALDLFGFRRAEPFDTGAAGPANVTELLSCASGQNCGRRPLRNTTSVTLISPLRQRWSDRDAIRIPDAVIRAVLLHCCMT